tara:strand:- start:1122 stop:1382 length:261 start_codon:yes stop_codon:yes gene_type:complete
LETSRTTTLKDKRRITNDKTEKHVKLCVEDRNKLENKQVGGLNLGLNGLYLDGKAGNKNNISQFFTNNIKHLYLRLLLKRVKYTCE